MKRYNKVALLAAMILAFAALPLGCSSRIGDQGGQNASNKASMIGDGGLLSTETCIRPCFFGIVPGITTRDQAVQTLQSKALYQDCHYFDTTNASGGRGISCDSELVILQDHADIVAGVVFQPSIEITVGDVIAKYGNPSAIVVVNTSLPEYAIKMGMTLYYDNINVVLGLPDESSTEYDYDLESRTRVENIQYFEQDRYLIERQNSQAWNGYGKYKETFH
jgi:hypothetical protein